MDALLATVVDRALGTSDHHAVGAKLRQRGELKLQPGKRWLRFRAEQTIQADTCGLRWDARVRMAPFLAPRILDSLDDGHGQLEVRLWRAIRLAHASGPEIDRGELLRYMAELPWCPYALLHNRALLVREVDGSTLSVSMRSNPQVEVRLHIDRTGDVVEARAESRPRLVGKFYVASPWSGVYSAHKQVGGVRIPTRAVVSWHLADGRFECFRGEILEWEALASESPSRRSNHQN